MLSSAVAVVTEEGYERMTVAKVTGRARVSRRTFYDLFEDREDCFLAAFDGAVAELAGVVVLAFEEGETRWCERIRAGLAALLGAFDAHPGLASLVVVDALAAGQRVAERRARVLGALSAVVDEGGGEASRGRELPALTGEGIVGAVAGVIHARVLERSPSPLCDLLNPLTAMIVLPYLGHAAARRELARPAPESAGGSSTAANVGAGAFRSASAATSLLEGLAMRLTYRTLKVLEVIAGHPGASNREVADAAGIHDQGQISKLLARLERLGLLQNTGEGYPSGAPNAWRLTPLGEQVEHATRLRPGAAEPTLNGAGGSR